MSQKRMKNNGWNIFFNILWITLLIIVCIYIIIAITISIKYHGAKKVVEKFTLNSLQTFFDDLNITYDLTKDPLDFKYVVSNMSRDLVDNLISYYDGNLNTVINSLQNVKIPPPTGGTYGTYGDFPNLPDIPGVLPKHFTDKLRIFLTILISNIPLIVIHKSAYLIRFFEILYLSTNTEQKQQLGELIARIIANIDNIINPPQKK
jgi:hypothetical protein